MPTFQRLPRFDQDWNSLTKEDRKRFRSAVGKFVADLDAGRPFRKSLRVRNVEGISNVWEVTFAPDGRATWQYGDEIKTGHAHVVWRRVGTHDIFRSP
ncbi:MAG: hypothetical protein ACYDEY_12385 [Acidimicrobiales bacterium]